MRHLSALIGLAFLVAGCATPGKTEPNDRFEDFNRRVFGLNETADRTFVAPLAAGYERVTPKLLRDSVGNAIDNLNTPTVLANDILQFKPKRAGITLSRFIFNSIWGLGGLFDPASELGLEQHTEDFGQTLAVWGVPSGPYLMVPFAGPSTVRDGIGTIVDSVAFDPFNWIEFGPNRLNDRLRFSRNGVGIINNRVELSEAFEALRSQPEPYIALRRAFLASLNAEIRDGALPEDPYEDLPDFDDFDDFDDLDDLDDFEDEVSSDDDVDIDAP